MYCTVYVCYLYIYITTHTYTHIFLNRRYIACCCSIPWHSSVLCKFSECSTAKLPSGSGQRRLRSNSRGPWHTSLPRAVERNFSTQLSRSPQNGDRWHRNGHDNVDMDGIPYLYRTHTCSVSAWQTTGKLLLITWSWGPSFRPELAFRTIQLTCSNRHRNRFEWKDTWNNTTAIGV